MGWRGKSFESLEREQAQSTFAIRCRYSSHRHHPESSNYMWRATSSQVFISRASPPTEHTPQFYFAKIWGRVEAMLGARMAVEMEKYINFCCSCSSFVSVRMGGKFQNGNFCVCTHNGKLAVMNPSGLSLLFIRDNNN